jgi:hypothetical protein
VTGFLAHRLMQVRGERVQEIRPAKVLKKRSPPRRASATVAEAKA